MATYTTSRAARTYPISGAGAQGLAQVAVGVYDYASNIAAASIIELCRLPAGACVYGGFVQASDLDTNGTEELDFDVGWAANGVDSVDTDGFGNFGAQTGDVSVHLPVTGIWMPFVNIIQDIGFKVFARPTTIIATINTDAATFTAGRFKVVVNYLVDPNFAV
ncbi:MAG: hypothetical protein V4527_18105 [Pseudomonadota bacterium]